MDISPNLWIMDQNDGLASLIGSEQRKGLNVLYTEEFEERMFQNAATVCPVKIIHVEKLII